MSDITVKVPAIEKLLDYGASGVGAIAGPLLAPWKASREAKARLAAAPVEAQVRRIEAESEAETSVIIAKARAEAREYLVAPDDEVHGTAEFTRRDIVQRIEFQERKRLANVRSVVDAAADELGDKEVNDHEPDPDWTARFFNEVQDVSSDDMQKIWAKILAGEVESPGRTSLRTLDILRNMTKRDAEMFSDLCPFIMGDGFVFHDSSVKNFGPLRLSNLLHLADCNLLNFGQDLRAIRQWGEEHYVILDYQNDALMVTSNRRPSGPLEIPARRLTTSGVELGSLNPRPPNMDYLRAFSKLLMSKDCRLEYLVGVEPLPNGMISYVNRIPIAPPPEQAEDPAP